LCQYGVPFNLLYSLSIVCSGPSGVSTRRSDSVRVTSSATEMEYVDELYQLVEAMARSLEKVREPVSELRLLVRGVHEVARKLETRLVKDAAPRLKGGATNGADAPPEQPSDEDAVSDSQLPAGVVATTLQYRPAGMSDTDPSDDEEWDALYPPGEPSSGDDADDDHWFLEEWNQRH
jgi:hypothetical protein